MEIKDCVLGYFGPIFRANLGGKMVKLVIYKILTSFFLYLKLHNGYTNHGSYLSDSFKTNINKSAIYGDLVTNFELHLQISIISFTQTNSFPDISGLYTVQVLPHFYNLKSNFWLCFDIINWLSVGDAAMLSMATYK